MLGLRRLQGVVADRLLQLQTQPHMPPSSGLAGFDEALKFVSTAARSPGASWGFTAFRPQSAVSMATSATDLSPQPGQNPLMQPPAPASPTGAVSPANQVPAPSTSGRRAQQAMSILRNASISPKKLDLAARLVRRMHIEDALLQMQVKHKKAAKMVHEQLWAARANAMHNHGLNPDRLCVERAEVGKGQYLRRAWPHGRGKSGIRHKYRSHLTIVLKEGNARHFTKVLPSLMERRSQGMGTRIHQVRKG